MLPFLAAPKHLASSGNICINSVFHNPYCKQESLAISRRNTVEEAPVPIQIVVDAQQPPQCRTAAQQAQDYSQDARKSHAGLPCSAMPPPSERRVSHVGSAASEARPATGNWGSGGGSESSGKDRSAAALEDVFVSAAFRMSETMELPHDGGAGDGSGGSAMGSPLRTQHPQLAGTAGVIMGISSAEQTHPAGASADTCAPRRNSGGKVPFHMCSPCGKVTQACMLGQSLRSRVTHLAFYCN